MSPAQIVPIIETWTKLYIMHLSPTSPLAQKAAALSLPPLGQDDIKKPSAQYRYMQIFENKGKTMGCSNPHPHGQIWTTTSLPEEPTIELRQLRKYREEYGGAQLLVDYAKHESEEKERTVFENKSFWAGVPYWATWPFEVMIISRQHKHSLVDLDSTEREDLAEVLAEITRRYDNLFETQFPYSEYHLKDLEAGKCLQQQAWGSTKPPSKARKKRWNAATSTSISTLRYYVVRPSGNSRWATRCWVNRSATSPPSRPQSGSARAEVSFTERGWTARTSFPPTAILPGAWGQVVYTFLCTVYIACIWTSSGRVWSRLSADMPVDIMQ